jgi:hypothetical protein
MSGWLTALRRYLVAVTIGNLAWEFAQMPLFTLWRTGTPEQMTFAALHCTAGDIGIAAASLAIALGMFGAPDWPRRRIVQVATATTIIGVAYTIYSEFVNTAVRGLWAYADLMPVVPGLGTGLAPLAQWLVVPPLALIWAARPRRASGAIAAYEAFDQPNPRLLKRRQAGEQNMDERR